MLSIVIINWNTKELLESCISHITGLRIRLPYEVIVVDNASTDGSREYLSARFMGRKLLNDKNRGFGAACNLAVRTFASDAYLFLNTDAFPEKGALEEMYTILKSADDIALVSPKLVNENRTMQKTSSRLPYFLRDPMLGKYNYIPSFFLKDAREYAEELVEEADAVTGACMMVKRETFISLGGFDEDFFFFLEETDFCLRCRRLGYRILVARRAACVHLKGKSTERELLRYRKIYLFSQFLFLKKHLPRQIYFFVACMEKANVFFKSIVYLFLSALTFFIIPKLRRKFHLYASFFKERGWKEAEKRFTGFFRGKDFYAYFRNKEGHGFMRKDLVEDFERLFPLEDTLEKDAGVIKDAPFALTSVLKIRDDIINVKLFRKKRWIPFLFQLPERAFYGAHVLLSLRISVPDVLGYFIRKKSRSSGYFFTRHDEDLQVLNFVFDDALKACASNRLRFAPVKRKLFVELAGVFRRLHDARVIHRDLKASNIMVKTRWTEENDPFQVYLIDFENIVVDPPFFERFRIKNLAQLHKSFPDLALVGPRERLFFLKNYLGVEKLDENAKNIIHQVEKMTGKIFKRKGLEFNYSTKINE